MGSAIIGGILGAKIAAPEDIFASDTSEDRLKALADSYGIKTVLDGNKIVAENSDILVLAVKPAVLYEVIEQIKAYASDKTVIVSIAAGQSIEKIEAAFEKEIKLVRVMPNTPALVSEGMSALALNKKISQPENAQDVKAVLSVFESLGRAELVSESLLDAVTGISGSGPAYVFIFIEALADAAVRGGMTRKQAYTFAAQTVLGSAKMVLETGKHPAELKDMVCSPAGTTIDAVKELEECGFRAAVMNAVSVCIDKSRSL